MLMAGGSPEAAVQTVMLIFTAATVVSGALLFGLVAWGMGDSTSGSYPTSSSADS